MKVAKITIRNIMGHESLDIKPGRVTRITGKNGTGKTSALQAIAAAFGAGAGGAMLLRDGEKVGEVVAVLDDGSSVGARVKDNGKFEQRRKSNGIWEETSQKRVKELAGEFSVNLMDLLNSTADKRIDMFLSALPARTEAMAIGPLLELCENRPDTRKHPLQVLSAIHKDIFSQRTGVNRAAKEKRSTVEQMREAMPPEPPDGKSWKDEQARLLARRDKLTEQCRSLIEEEKSNCVETVKHIQDGYSHKIEAIRLRLSEEIERLRVAADAEIEQARSECQRMESVQEKSRDAVIKSIEDRALPVITRIVDAFAAATVNAEAQVRAETVKKTIDDMTAGAEQLEAQSAALSEALEDVERHKVELLKSLPIPGVEVSDDIYVDGVIWNRLNTAKKVALIVEIAKMKCAHLPVPIICIDGIECLDSDSYAAFEAAVETSNVTAFVTEVTDGEFAIESK